MKKMGIYTCLLFALTILFSIKAEAIEDQEIDYTQYGNTYIEVNNLTDGMTLLSSRLTFDVIARSNGQTINSAVTLNFNPVTPTWVDGFKTSYTLTFSETGTYIVTVAAGTVTETYMINYIKTYAGDVIGHAAVCVEMFTIGRGYLIEPVLAEIREGDTAADLLLRLLEENGFTCDTDRYEKSFYLKAIIGSKVSSIPTDTSAIPEDLCMNLDMYNIELADRYQADSLGEFDYTSLSGWMYCVNSVFPNVGFGEYYLADGDVMRVQFTLAYGIDIGGSYAMGADWGQFFEEVNKDELTKLVANVNARYGKEQLEENGMYLHALEVLQNLLATQSEVDEALEQLRTLDEHLVTLTAQNITSFSGTITVTYNPEVLKLVSAAAQVQGAYTSVGAIPGTGITIMSSSPGVLTLAFDTTIPQGKTWSGSITILKFMVLASGPMTVNVS